MVSFLLLVDLAGAYPGIFLKKGVTAGKRPHACNEQAGGVRQAKPVNIYLFYFENQNSCQKLLYQ